MDIGFKTDAGYRRVKNEDALKILPEKNFFMIADGVGGNRSGEVASSATLDLMEAYLDNHPIEKEEGSERIFRYFQEAVSFVNSSILDLSETHKEYQGMATTLVFVYLSHRILYAANVGDSRVYFIHNNEIHQITEDHTYVNNLIKMGAISRDEAENHKRKNVITRDIGDSAYNHPDCYNIYVEEDDKILICSDGLYEEVSEEEMLEAFNEAKSMQECADRLVLTANEHGGSDNISVICVSLGEGDHE